MIMASTRRRELEAVLVKTPRWKRENIGYIDPAEPLKMIYGRQHYLIHWEIQITYMSMLIVHMCRRWRMF